MSVHRFNFQGKEYIQDSDKADQQWEEAHYSGVQFCLTCPTEIVCACMHWEWESGPETGMWRGEDNRSLHRLKKPCSDYGRPEPAS